MLREDFVDLPDGGRSIASDQAAGVQIVVHQLVRSAAWTGPGIPQSASSGDLRSHSAAPHPGRVRGPADHSGGAGVARAEGQHFPQSQTDQKQLDHLDFDIFATSARISGERLQAAEDGSRSGQRTREEPSRAKTDWNFHRISSQNGGDREELHRKPSTIPGTNEPNNLQRSQEIQAHPASANG